MDENGLCFCGDTHITKLVATTCGHVFHSPCISEWISRSDRCPICRKPHDKRLLSISYDLEDEINTAIREGGREADPQADPLASDNTLLRSLMVELLRDARDGAALKEEEERCACIKANTGEMEKQVASKDEQLNEVLSTTAKLHREFTDIEGGGLGELRRLVRAIPEVEKMAGQGIVLQRGLRELELLVARLSADVDGSFLRAAIAAGKPGSAAAGVLAAGGGGRAGGGRAGPGVSLASASAAGVAGVWGAAEVEPSLPQTGMTGVLRALGMTEEFLEHPEVWMGLVASAAADGGAARAAAGAASSSSSSSSLSSAPGGPGPGPVRRGLEVSVAEAHHWTPAHAFVSYLAAHTVAIWVQAAATALDPAASAVRLLQTQALAVAEMRSNQARPHDLVLLHFSVPSFLFIPSE